MDTKVLETQRLTFGVKVLPQSTEAPEFNHPSFVNALPAIIAEPVALGYCTDCAYLARMIRAGRHIEQYAWTAIQHVETQHASPGPRLRRELPGPTSSPHRDGTGNDDQCTGGPS